MAGAIPPTILADQSVLAIQRELEGVLSTACLSASVLVLPGDRLVGEPHACLGVDVHTAHSAPAWEAIWIDVDALDDRAVTDDLLFDALRLAKPLFPATRKIIGIYEHPEHGRVVLLPVPSDADRSDGLGHSTSIAPPFAGSKPE